VIAAPLAEAALARVAARLVRDRERLLPLFVLVARALVAGVATRAVGFLRKAEAWRGRDRGTVADSETRATLTARFKLAVVTVNGLPTTSNLGKDLWIEPRGPSRSPRWAVGMVHF